MMGPFVTDFPNEHRQFVTDEPRYFSSFFQVFLQALPGKFPYAAIIPFVKFQPLT